jgi:hypothetical protein
MVFDQLDYGLIGTLRNFFISGGAVGFSIGSVKLFFDGTMCLLVPGCSDALRIYRFASVICVSIGLYFTVYPQFLCGFFCRVTFHCQYLVPYAHN